MHLLQHGGVLSEIYPEVSYLWCVPNTCHSVCGAGRPHIQDEQLHIRLTHEELDAICSLRGETGLSCSLRSLFGLSLFSIRILMKFAQSCSEETLRR